MLPHYRRVTVEYDYISESSDLRRFCESIADAPDIFFDTEFVSENTYRPELCLIQVSAKGQLAIIDPLTADVSPFWELLSSGNHNTVVHAGREEFRFCFAETKRRPQNMFDVQLAAGLVGLEYPASYAKLIARLLGEKLPKGETRTNWLQRPLTEKQLDYALLDVHYLPDIRKQLVSELTKLGRLSWLDDEMEVWQNELVEAEGRETWRRVSGISGLSNRALVIVRELWRWREAEARRMNRPPRRLLRDDLIVELARRGTSDLRHVKAIRGIERSGAKRYLEDIARCIETAMSMPTESLPKNSKSGVPNQVAVLGQFLATALTSICRSKNLAPSIVGTAQDVRDFVAHELGFSDANDPPPKLAQGWRSEVVGETLAQLLRGQMSIRIADALSDDPLRFDPAASASGENS